MIELCVHQASSKPMWENLWAAINKLNRSMKNVIDVSAQQCQKSESKNLPYFKPARSYRCVEKAYDHIPTSHDTFIPRPPPRLLPLPRHPPPWQPQLQPLQCGPNLADHLG